MRNVMKKLLVEFQGQLAFECFNSPLVSSQGGTSMIETLMHGAVDGKALLW